MSLHCASLDQINTFFSENWQPVAQQGPTRPLLSPSHDEWSTHPGRELRGWRGGGGRHRSSLPGEAPLPGDQCASSKSQEPLGRHQHTSCGEGLRDTRQPGRAQDTGLGAVLVQQPVAEGPLPSLGLGLGLGLGLRKQGSLTRPTGPPTGAVLVPLLFDSARTWWSSWDRTGSSCHVPVPTAPTSSLPLPPAGAGLSSRGNGILKGN